DRSNSLSFKRVLRKTAIICLFLGVLAVASGVREENASYDSRDKFSSTQYVLGATKWPSWAVAMLVYANGLTARNGFGVLLSFGLILATSTSRYGVILPAMYMAFATISKMRTRKLRLWMPILALSIWLVWIPLKQVQGQIKADGVGGVTKAFSTALDAL